MEPDLAIDWTCPFCGNIAQTATSPSPLSYSRTCECGAIALAAPSRDYDEITDDAIGIFSVQIRPDSRGFEQLLRRDILAAGIEIRDGAIGHVTYPVTSRESNRILRDEYRSVWFRRKDGPECA